MSIGSVNPNPGTAPAAAAPTPAAPPQSSIDRFLAQAMAFQGQPYRWGGGHGGTMSGPGPVDCSGLVMQAARQAGLNLDGTAAVQQRNSTPISKADLKPGDLVFNGRPARHVGIYIGNGKVLHAPKTGDVVRVASVNSFQSAGRPHAFSGQTGQAVAPGSSSGLALNSGPSTGLSLPHMPIAPGGPVPPYADRFGRTGHVRNPRDASLVNLAKNAVLKDPELANTPLGQHAKEGRIEPSDVIQLQRYLESKGYPVGDTGVDGLYGPRTHRAMAAFLEGKPPENAPNTGAPALGAPTTNVDSVPGDEKEAEERRTQALKEGRLAAGRGQAKDGHTIPGGGEGRATTFANGHIQYKGWSDAGNRQNGGIGAWGDKNAPTEYFCALPVGLKGEKSADWWHNQKILVTNPATGQQVVVRVQDKGPNPKTGNAIDLSPVAMEGLGGTFNGSMNKVKFEFAADDAPVGPVRRR